MPQSKDHRVEDGLEDDLIFVFVSECDKYSYIQIFSVRNIRAYYIRIIFSIRIYSDIRSYHFFYTNIFGYIRIVFFYTNTFGYSFVSKFHIRHIHTSSPTFVGILTLPRNGGSGQFCLMVLTVTPN